MYSLTLTPLFTLALPFQILERIAISFFVSIKLQLLKSDMSWFNFVVDNAIGMFCCVIHRKQT